MSDYPRVRALIAELASVDLSEVQQPIVQLVTERRDLFLDPLRYLASQMDEEKEYLYTSVEEGDGGSEESKWFQKRWDDLGITFWSRQWFPDEDLEDLYSEDNEASGEYFEASDSIRPYSFTREQEAVLPRDGEVTDLIEHYEQQPTRRQIQDMFVDYYGGDFFADYEPAINAYEAGIFADVHPAYVAIFEGALGLHPSIHAYIVKVMEFKRAGKSIKDA